MAEEHRSLESYTEKEKWASMSWPQRIHYIWDYYKIPILIACLVLYVGGYFVYRQVTRKEPVLYTALANVPGEEPLTYLLTDGFLDYANVNPSKNEVMLYANWYITDDSTDPNYQLAYATTVQTMATTQEKMLDVILMDQTAFDHFAENGFLCDLEELLTREDPQLYESVKPYLTENTVNLLEETPDTGEAEPASGDSASSENVSGDTAPGEAMPDEAASASTAPASETYPMAIDLTACTGFRPASAPDITIYLGIVSNTPRTEIVMDYLRYLITER